MDVDMDMFPSTVMPPSPLTRVFDFTRYPALVDSVCSYLGIRDILALSRTCKDFSGIYPFLLRTQWNVDRRLSRFVRDPHALRSKLGEFDALIAGGFATQYFDRVLWSESDLDIFVQTGPDSDGIQEHLARAERYTHHPEPHDDYPWDPRELAGVHTFLKMDSTGQTLKVQVVLMKNKPLLGIIRDFYSSVVVNIISSTKAYAIFAGPTFVERKAYYFKKPDEYNGVRMTKYRRRGFRSENVQWPDAHQGAFSKHRRVGDHFTWIIPFDNRAIRAPRTPDWVLEYGTFGMTVADTIGEGETALRFYYPEATEFKACTLQYRYVAANHMSHDTFWMGFVGPRMDELTILGFRTMAEAKPADLVEGSYPIASMQIYLDRFVPGDQWQYYDAEIPKWYALWERLH